MTQQNIRENQYPPYPILIFFTVFFSYLIFLEPLPEWNSNRSIALVQAIVNDHSFKINSFHENTGDKVLYEGDYYTAGAPGLALIAVPFYLPYYLLEKTLPWKIPSIFLHMYLTAAVVCTSSALLAILLWGFLLNLVDKRQAFLLVAVFSFGTIEFFYSLRFFAHVPASLLSFGAFLLLLREKGVSLKKSWKEPFLAGGLVGLSVFVDYVAMPIAAFLIVYALLIVKWRRIPYVLLGCFFGLMPLLMYHAICFGTPFVLPSKYVGYKPVVLENQLLAEMSVPQKLIMVADHFLRMQFGPRRGHLFYMPVFFLSVYGFFRGWAKKAYHKEILFSLLVLFGYPVIIGSRPITWTCGSAFGLRYMVQALPFMMLGMAFALHSTPRKLFFFLCTLSICINFFGVCSGDIPQGENIFYLFKKHIIAFPMTPPFLRMREFFPFYAVKFVICCCFLCFGWLKWGRNLIVKA